MTHYAVVTVSNYRCMHISILGHLPANSNSRRSEPIFTPSTVTHDGSSVHRDTSVRDSEVALVPRTASVKCIESRARALQGWRDEVWIERLRVQRYHPGGHYGHHFDWSSGRGGWGRVSSFMAWVAEDGLEGGGTEFPALSRKGDPRWCRFVECGEGGGGGGGANNGNNGANASASTTTSTLADRSEQSGEAVNGDGGERGGVVFKPLVGNAVYWENFRADGSGRGYEESWHAGLPVVQGVKVGLNIWSWGRID